LFSADSNVFGRPEEAKENHSGQKICHLPARRDRNSFMKNEKKYQQFSNSHTRVAKTQ
jgi:hypothetical protein